MREGLREAPPCSATRPRGVRTCAGSSHGTRAPRLSVLQWETPLRHPRGWRNFIRRGRKHKVGMAHTGRLACIQVERHPQPRLPVESRREAHLRDASIVRTPSSCSHRRYSQRFSVASLERASLQSARPAGVPVRWACRHWRAVRLWKRVAWRSSGSPRDLQTPPRATVNVPCRKTTAARSASARSRMLRVACNFNAVTVIMQSVSRAG